MEKKKDAGVPNRAGTIESLTRELREGGTAATGLTSSLFSSPSVSEYISKTSVFGGETFGKVIKVNEETNRLRRELEETVKALQGERVSGKEKDDTIQRLEEQMENLNPRIRNR